MRCSDPRLAVPIALVLIGALGLPARAAPAPEPDGDEPTETHEPEQAESPRAQRDTRRIVGGAVAGGFGLILGIVAFGLLGARSTCEIEGEPSCARDMGIAALATGVPALALLATGGVLLGLGIKSRRAHAGTRPVQARLAPWTEPHAAGAALWLRF